MISPRVGAQCVQRGPWYLGAGRPEPGGSIPSGVHGPVSNEGPAGDRWALGHVVIGVQKG
jgi:hypothetical protein